jgi:dolichyl-phosphate-mannose-protein mannosyltransferase
MSSPQPPPSRQPRSWRPWAALSGAGLCVAAFWVAGTAANHYVILYGRHGWAPPEVAFLLNFVLLGLPCAALLSAALARWWGPRVAADFDRLPGLPGPSALRAAGLAALIVGALIVLARYGLLRDTAITDDENVYDFMARMWAGGHLSVPSPPPEVRAFFENQFIVNDGRWYGIYAPGHPALLTLGQGLGAIRWVTTIEAMLTVLLAWGLADRVFGRRAALLTLGLLVVSPFFVLISATMLAHATAALALTAFAYAAARALEAPAAKGWWLGAGCALGWDGLTRPLAAAAFSLPWLVLLALTVRRDRRAAPGAALFVLAGATAAALFAGYNAAVTGSAVRTGYEVFAKDYGFTFTLGSLPAAAPVAALYEFYYSLARLNFWLLGWPVSLALVPFARRTPAGLALGLGSLGTLLAYAVFRIPSITVVGPVHYGELAVPLLVLSASGLERLALAAERRLGPAARDRVLSAPLALTTVTILFFWPVYAPSLRQMATLARAPYDLVEQAGLDHAVVFVQSLPALEAMPGAWVYRHRNNSPDLSDPVLFVNDLGAPDARLRAWLPGRKAYRMRMEGGRLALSELP